MDEDCVPSVFGTTSFSDSRWTIAGLAFKTGLSTPSGRLMASTSCSAGGCHRDVCDANHYVGSSSFLLLTDNLFFLSLLCVFLFTLNIVSDFEKKTTPGSPRNKLNKLFSKLNEENQFLQYRPYFIAILSLIPNIPSTKGNVLRNQVPPSPISIDISVNAA